ncbi:MAG: ATP-binding cassette domain-containing protein [Methylobacteriaceae bacterium]|jgi:molybdate transport system ATP-binding protein|nr:ATP-binding cassette domain-containing protein [Methylobacteriaceae bacterium]
MLDVHIVKKLRTLAHPFELNVTFSAAETVRRLVVLGPSGAGKTQTLKAIAGLTTPDDGFIRFSGQSLFHHQQHVNLTPQARAFSFVFQDYALFPHLTVRQNIAFGLRTGPFNPRRAMRFEPVEMLLNRFHLIGVADEYPDVLSGGEKQRVALARAIIVRPRLLILDEPFAALDEALRDTMREELAALLTDYGFPLIMISHDKKDAELFADQVIELSNGVVVASG